MPQHNGKAQKLKTLKGILSRLYIENNFDIESLTTDQITRLIKQLRTEHRL